MTGGERALGLALRQHWPNRVVVAHCQDHVAAEVVGHLPAGERAQAREALRAAWEGPQAARELGALADAWQQAHPGAAARLRSEVEPTTAIDALGVHGALALRLRVAVPARYLLEHALPAGRGRSGRDWVAAIAGRRTGGRPCFAGCRSMWRWGRWCGRSRPIRLGTRPDEGERGAGQRRSPGNGCAPAG